ncbi:MAG: helix-turn-helix domain-containing protein [Cellulomonas sp.]|jgi:DNA-binding transcriptional regulator YiaG|nr:helix-turn-helix domain-containing protein [Cellulomonas sp.]
MKGFRDRNAEITARINVTPEHRAAVDRLVEATYAEERAYQMHLAAVRQAGHLTQVELARRLGVGQGNVSRLENRPDMLYSTLLAYLQAAGAQDVALTATVAGQRIEVVLDALTANHGAPAADPEPSSADVA